MGSNQPRRCQEKISESRGKMNAEELLKEMDYVRALLEIEEDHYTRVELIEELDDLTEQYNLLTTR